MLTRAMAKQLSATLAHECLFVDFLSKEEPKKVSEALKHPGWTFAPVARLEAIRIFLAFATYMNFIVYQMNVKSAFLNGKLKEEVYVKQPLGFESNEFPNHVFKLDKALYGLKQAPRAWYETLSNFLTEYKFVRGKIDNTLFVYKTQTDVILVQIYVDDIIFGSTSKKLCKQYAKLMTQRYEMSMMGVLTYFLGFQIKQSKRGISINQEKYVKDLLKSFDLKGYSDSDYIRCNMDRKATSVLVPVAMRQLCAGVLKSSNLYHFIRDHILKRDIELHFIPTQYQLADIFTKPLDEPTFKRLIVELAIRPWFAMIGYNGEIGAKGTFKKSCLPTRWRAHNKSHSSLQCSQLDTKPNQPEEPPFTNHMKAIYNLDVLVDFKAPKYSSPTEEVPQDKKPGAKNGLRRKQSSKHTSESTTKASKS
ncbi:retrovirus-related pol polyprotein from transposon TNT 1-94 [Tanacetum coccineum]|uniref:Retrovirus-related pol polyprotein from transposon TNT 1-94 n=1 Tax=Tanacetum coccineum TaxID=301880 RepID=A0ABQ4X5D8_9ASTR